MKTGIYRKEVISTHNILIAEDKDIIREGLIKIIKEMNFPILNIYEASNGQQALEMAKKYEPKIIITDIVMPKMSGLDLIKALSESPLECQFIILSGYRDFNYAKKAITYGVHEYLLKPVKKTELYSVLKQLILKINKSEKPEAHSDDIYRYVDKINELKKIWIKKVLHHQYISDENFSYNGDSDIIINENKYRTMSVFINCAINSKHKKQIEKSSFEIYTAIKESHKVLYYYKIEWNYILCIIKYDEDPKKLDSFKKQIYKNLDEKKRLGLNISIGLSSPSGEINSLPNLIQQADKALICKIYNSNNQIFTYEENSSFDKEAILGRKNLETIINSILFGKQDVLSNNIDSLLFRISSIDKSKADALVYSMQKINYALKESCKKIGIPMSLEEDIRNTILASETESHLSRSLKEILFDKSREINKEDRTSKNAIIRFVLKYVDQNYNTNISLDTLSRLVFMNSNYLSTLFKASTGQNFVSYIQKLRIEKSKEFLANPKMKIYEVAEAVGFSNDKYYCRVFKALIGATPVEYRNKIIF